MMPRIGFVTCVQLGLSCIETVLDMGGRFDLFVTLEDERARRKSGRIYLDEVAEKHSTPLLKVRHINDSETLTRLRAYDLDWLFVIGWSQILSEEALGSAHQGVLGMHPTLLPIGRGRASIPWAILQDLDRTGVTVFKLDGGVDTGPIVAQKVVPLAPTETATTLYGKVDLAHQALMTTVWPAVSKGEVVLHPQDDAMSTEWRGRRPEDGRILPDMAVREVDRLVRATTRPYPGAYLDLGDGRGRLRIWAGSVEASEGESVRAIELRDGTYFATHFQHETSP